MARASKNVYHPQGDANNFQTVEGELDGIRTGIVGKVTITQPANAATLTIADGKTLTANSTATIAGGDGNTLAIAANKTLTVDKSLEFDGTDATKMTFPPVSGNVTISATAAQYQANTAGNTALIPSIVWAAVADVALTDGASITVDMATGFNFTVSIAGNRTLANPSNAKPGQSGCFKVTASGGTRTITVAANYVKTSDITFPVSIASGQKAFIYYHVDDATHINITAVLNNPT